MRVARLHGPRDLRLEQAPEPPPPGPGQVLVEVKTVGICGSDLHYYADGGIGEEVVETPFILGHEFAGVVAAVGPEARDGLDQPLRVGQRVTVDPATPCYRCPMCESGRLNLCLNLHFHGSYPDDGALQERLLCAARSCFPLPDSVSDAAGALLEPLGIALHSTDLPRLRVTESVAILGCGPIGLLLLNQARRSGADPIYAFDCFPWRVEKAKAWGATDAWTLDAGDPVAIIMDRTAGRGVDVVFEAAWADHSVNQAAGMACRGGRVVLVGIPGKADALHMRHSLARGKELDILMSHRMINTYPRAFQMVTATPALVDLDGLVSHRFPLAEIERAYALNTAYEDGVLKVVIDVGASS